MHMHIAKWTDRFELMPEPEDVRLLIRSRYEAIVCDGELVFLPTQDNTVGSGLGLQTKDVYSEGKYRRYSFHFTNAALLSDLDPWPYFGAHLIELNVDGDGTLRWELPPPHELPWPQLVSKSRIRQRECVKRDLPLRLRSAVAAGVDPREVVRTTPRWAKSALTAPEWRTLVEGALEDV